MTEQDDALQLAEWFEKGHGGCELEAAAKLRRLHSVNAQLLEALEFIAGHDLAGAGDRAAGHIAHILIYSARAAIAAAKEGT